VRILIADDDAVSRRLLEATLVRLGHDVVSVADGSEAITALLTSDGPRLAILDWVMPGADGLAVCRAVRRHAAPYVYVILLSARNSREDRVIGIDAEVDDFLTKPFDSTELVARLRSGERVIALQARLLEVQEALRFEAAHDRLTGLWTRGMVLDQLERELRRARREGRSIGVVMTDVDHFKCVNDTHGHAAGDAVLKQTADRLRAVVRDYDFIGRYGGEEFLLVLPSCNAAVAAGIADRAREVVATLPMDTGRGPLSLTLSLGLAWSRAASEEADELIQLADEALYRAKALGRNRVEARILDLART
jgi:diguanylate cyclase (GGDEF)-like protein